MLNYSIDTLYRGNPVAALKSIKPVFDSWKVEYHPTIETGVDIHLYETTQPKHLCFSYAVFLVLSDLNIKGYNDFVRVLKAFAHADERGGCSFVDDDKIWKSLYNKLYK